MMVSTDRNRRERQEARLPANAIGRAGCLIFSAVLLSSCRPLGSPPKPTATAEPVIGAASGTPSGIATPSSAATVTRFPRGTTEPPPDLIRQQGFVPLFADLAQPDGPDAHLDLDTGEKYDVEESDIKFVISQGTVQVYLLQPVNGATAAAVGETEPGLEGCRLVLDALSAGNIPETRVSLYLCVLTNDGRLSQLRVDEIGHLGPGSLQVSFVTWEEVIRAP